MIVNVSNLDTIVSQFMHINIEIHSSNRNAKRGYSQDENKQRDVFQVHRFVKDTNFLIIDDRELLVAVVGVVGALGKGEGEIALFTSGLLAQSEGVLPFILNLIASLIVTE
jgi:hypothetical protein